MYQPKKAVYALCILLCLSNISWSQSTGTADKDYNSYPYWIEMMQDPQANFFETQLAFEKYWESREIQKACGWKPFKRWEAFMSARVDQNGNKPDPLQVSREFQKYIRSGKRSASLACEWSELGPSTVPNNGTNQPTGNGRINEIAFHPTDPNKLYIGAPQGGMWMTSDHGVTWTTTTDDLATLGVSAIIVDNNNPQIIYLGTGDRDHSSAPGRGVYKSTDGGQTFTVSNSGMGNATVARMIQHPTNSSILLAATSNGIYRSINSGGNWTRTSTGGGFYKDIVFKPGDPNIVYASYNGGFYRSANNGASWILITAGIPDAYRMAIAVSADASNEVYVLATNSSTFKALYKSTDSGLNFTTQSTSPNLMDYSSSGSGSSGQAWYCMDISVDPANSGNVYVGGVNIFKSTNDGVNWSINAHWVGSGAPSIHADQHSLEYSPINNRLYACHDGGLHYTTNGGSTWIDITGNLAIAQAYKIGQSATVKDLVINGYQDNGTALFDNGTWRTEIGGDGMECLVDNTDANYVYGSIYYGSIRRSTNNGLSFSVIAANGVNGINEAGAWVTPYCLSEQDPNTMFIGYDNVWRSTNVKTTFTSSIVWTKISSALGGFTGNLSKIEASPASANVLFVTRGNTLFRSINVLAATPAWTDLSSSLPSSTTINDIECHPTNVNIIYMLAGTEVYKSGNQGQTWTNISGTLPNIWMNTIVFEPGSNEGLYLGADAGVYYKNASMTDWVLYANKLPVNSEITELEIFYDASNADNSRIRGATYGRGLWEAPLAAVPLADYNEGSLAGCAPINVSFTDASVGCIDTYTWDVVGPVNSNSSGQSPILNFPVGGNYTVKLTVSNAVGTDTISKQFVIGSSPVATAAVTNESCLNLSDGTIDLTVVQTNPPYVYNWSDGSTIEDRVNLPSGNYTVTVTDDAGCTNELQYIVSDDAQLLVTTSKSNVSCFNLSNGSAIAVASGNDAPFTYQWNTTPVQSGNILSGISGAIYEVTVTDDNGCTKTSNVNIFEPNELTVFLLPDFPAVGQMQVLVTGGIAPYNYNWSTGATTQGISGMPPGFYFCQVSDYNSCAKTPAITYAAPSPIPNYNSSFGVRIKNVDRDFLNVFPNPNSGKFDLHLDPMTSGTFDLKVLNSVGQMVYFDQVDVNSTVDLEIDLGHLEPAVYFIQISGNKTNMVKKILISR